MQFVVVANPGSERVALFQAALHRLGLPPAQLVPYSELLDGRASLTSHVRPGSVVRIESPDLDFEVERAILALGAQQPDEEGEYARASHRELAALSPDKGAILFPRQWYLGYRELLRRIEEQLAASPPHCVMNHPTDIAAMFDKPRCHSLLSSSGLPVPRSLAPLGSPVRSYDHLRARMRDALCHRVIVKLAHGSSASGVVAYRFSGERHQATTTVEIVPTQTGPRLYNSRRLRVYTDQREIASLVDALCAHRVHVEEWLPKAGFQNHTFDLRVVVIADQARHVVVRLNRGTLTNLHLNPTRTGGRTDLASLLTRLDPATWDAARHTCERAMSVFPRSHYAGIDLLITSDHKRHAIAEVNAFGDLLYGNDTYTTEIEALKSLHIVSCPESKVPGPESDICSVNSGRGTRDFGLET